jgi:hypothetical protein
MTLEEVVKTLVIGARIPGRSQREHDEVKGLDEALAFVEANRIKVEEINLEVLFIFCFNLSPNRGWLIGGGQGPTLGEREGYSPPTGSKIFYFFTFSLNY